MKNIRIGTLFIGVCVFLIVSCKKERLASPEPKGDIRETVILSGHLGKHPLVMELHCVNDSVRGACCYYNGMRKNSTDLQQIGRIEKDGRLDLYGWALGTEFHCDHFIGYFSPKKGYKGRYDQFDGKVLPFDFAVKEIRRTVVQ